MNIHSEYYGWTIWTKNHCGMWKATCYSDGRGSLAADTLEGLRFCIREVMQPHR